MTDTTIQWTDKTWNPVRGCSLVSPGCTNCYAMRVAHRFRGPYEGLTKATSHGPVWTGNARAVPEKLDEPMRWRKPARVFVNSMSDLFHEDIADDFILEVFRVMANAFQHTFQVLTKRPARMKSIIARIVWVHGTPPAILKYGDGPAHLAIHHPIWRERWDDLIKSGKVRLGDTGQPDCWPLGAPPNVWLGVSVEDQQRADERIPMLLQTAAAVRFLSCEPLLEKVDLTWLGHDGDGVIDCLRGEDWVEDWLDQDGTRRARRVVSTRDRVNWVIVGGESGPGARTCDVEWIRAVIAQCNAASVKVFVKQLGANPAPLRVEGGSVQERLWLRDRAGGDPAEWPEDLRVREFPA